MKHSPTSIINDENRLREIDELHLNGDFSTTEYDAITELASFICKTPVALVSIVKSNSQYFVSHHGFDKSETPLEESICATAIQEKDRVFISEDTRIDERIKDNLSVTGDNNIVFYAGVPLLTENGHALGTLCVIDHKPRTLNQAQIDALKNLANQVLQLFELRRTHLLLEKSKDQLSDESERLKNIIEATRAGTWEWNVKTGEVLVNDRYLQMLGYTRDELEPINIDTWYKLVHPADKEYSDLKIQECFDKKSKFYNIDCRLIHKNGHDVWVNDRGRVAAWDTDGEPLIMSGTHTDMTEKISARMALKQSEEKYKYLFEHNPAPMFIWDFETKEIIDCNSAASMLYGYSRKEFLNLSVIDIRPKEDIGRIEGVSVNEDVYSNYNREMHNDLWRHLKKSGELMHVRIKAHLLDFHGRRASLVLINDETDARAAELALMKSEKKLKTAASIAKLGYWDLDLDTNELNWSDEVYDIWEQNPAKFKPNYERFASTIHPEDLRRFEDEQEKSRKGEQELNVYHRIITPKGEVKWVHELGRLVRDSSGYLIRFEGTVQDVTEQKREEQKSILMNSVATNTNDSVVIAEAEFEDGQMPKIIYVNEAFTRLTGYSADEVVGSSREMLHGPKTDKAELARLKDAMKRWESCEMTTVNYKKNGQEYWVNFKMSPVANDMGWYTHWVSLERDVTERRNREIQKELLGDLGQLFNNHPNLKPCLEDVLVRLCEFGDFDLTEIWLTNPRRNQINMDARHSAGKKAKAFYAESASIHSFKKGEGLPGCVWKKGESLIWGKIDKRKGFVRREAAAKSEIKSVLGVPLTYNNKVLGVFVVGTSDAKNTLGFYRDFFNSFQAVLGTEIQRKQLEEQLHNIFEAAPEIICVANNSGYFTKVNPAMSGLLGYSESELLSTPVLNFVHPADVDATARAFAGEGVVGDIIQIENRYLTKSGKTIWLSWTAKSVDDGEAAYCVAKDITEQVELKRLLHEATNLSRVGGWDYDLVRNRYYWSDMTREIHEVSNKFQVNLERTFDFYRKDFRALAKNAFEESINSAVPFDFEAVIVTAEGNERWVRTIGKVETAKGKPTRMYGSIQDIQERKTVELRLQNTVNNIPGAIFQYKLNPDGTNEMDFV
ncbi:MAG: PAS domain S-box protein, partial [Cryomorphaceae bacterium]